MPAAAPILLPTTSTVTFAARGLGCEASAARASGSLAEVPIVAAASAKDATESSRFESPMPISILQATGLVKRVPTAEGELTILQDVDLSVDAGARLAVVGESGSGKTTLLGILAGLELPSGGDVWLDGDQITAMNEERRARVRARCVGFVFQSFQLIDSLTALENVMLPLELRGDGQAKEAAREFLARVGLAARTTHYPRQLSGGEQQRVAIARAFASRPKVLFADEPTGNLDTHTGERVAQLLFDLNREAGTTLVLVTHDVALAGRCGATITLDAGRIASAAGDDPRADGAAPALPERER